MRCGDAGEPALCGEVSANLSPRIVGDAPPGASASAATGDPKRESGGVSGTADGGVASGARAPGLAPGVVARTGDTPGGTSRGGVPSAIARRREVRRADGGARVSEATCRC